jgi:hypothetical protein
VKLELLEIKFNKKLLQLETLLECVFIDLYQTTCSVRTVSLEVKLQEISKRIKIFEHHLIGVFALDVNIEIERDLFHQIFIEKALIAIGCQLLSSDALAFEKLPNKLRQLKVFVGSDKSNYFQINCYVN